MRMLQKSFLSLVAGGIWTLGSVAWAGTMDTGAPFPTPADGPPFEVAAPPFPTPVDGRPFDLPVDGPPFEVLLDGPPFDREVEAAAIAMPADGAPFPTPVDGPPFEVEAPPFTTPVEGRPFDLPVDGPPFDVVRLGSRIEAAGIYWTTLAGLVALPPPTSAAQIANPEPTTWLLLGLGLGGLGVLRRVRSRG
jgi:hypothetical protein